MTVCPETLTNMGISGCGKILELHEVRNSLHYVTAIYQFPTGARKIRALRVRCDNLDNGCQWTGELGELETHLQSCDHALIPCTNECKDTDQIVKVPRKNLQDHLTNECPARLYQCPHCKEMGEYQERATSHLETCSKVKVPCPNAQCPVGMPRYKLSTHRLTCDYEPVPCKYAEVGCEERPPRKGLKTHEEDDQLHLRVTTEKVLSLTRKVSDLYTEMAMLINQQSKAAALPVTSRLTDFQKHKNEKDIICGLPFYTSPTGYKMCMRVDANGCGDGEGTHVSVFVYLMKGDNDDSLTWPFTGTGTFELLNQLEDESHYKDSVTFPADSESSERVVDGERGIGGGYPQFISHTDLDQPDKNCQYLKDDTLVFRVSVQEPENNPHPKPWLVPNI